MRSRGAAAGAVARVGAQRGELGLERAEAGVRRIETVERGVDVAGLRERLEDGGRIRRVVGIIAPARKTRCGAMRPACRWRAKVSAETVSVMSPSASASASLKLSKCGTG